MTDRRAVYDLMEQCLRAACADLNLSGQEPRPAGLMAEVETLPHALRCLARVRALCEAAVTPGCMAGTGYYLQMDMTNPPHPLYTLGVLYALTLADARVYLEHADSYLDEPYTVGLTAPLLRRFVRFCEQAETVPVRDYCADEDVTAFVKAHPDIRRAVVMGDCPNALHRWRMFAELGLTLHCPGALWVWFEYRSEEALAADEAVWTLGERCFEGLVDYDAYRSADNAAEEFTGMSFGDLFWGLEDMVRAWQSLPVPRDRLTALVLADRPLARLALPAGLTECCRVVHSSRLDPEEPLYDFGQLVEGG